VRSAVNWAIKFADHFSIGAKAKYDVIHSVYVYSLAPVPLIVRVP